MAVQSKLPQTKNRYVSISKSEKEYIKRMVSKMLKDGVPVHRIAKRLSLSETTITAAIDDMNGIVALNEAKTVRIKERMESVGLAEHERFDPLDRPDYEPPNKPLSTRASAGSKEKIAVIIQRLMSQEDLWHPNDGVLELSREEEQTHRKVIDKKNKHLKGSRRPCY
jgi:hypothetical protein